MTKTIRTFLVPTLFILSLGGRAALAQEGGPAPVVTSSGGASSDGHGPGVGVEQTLGGATGATFVYDTSKFHIVGLFGLDHQSGPDSTTFAIGGRFLYHLSKMAHADFSIGAGLSILFFSPNNGPNETNLHIELIAQARVWLTENVAISGSLGFVLLTADNFLITGGPVTNTMGNGAFGIGGDLNANFGFTYFFK